MEYIDHLGNVSHTHTVAVTGNTSNVKAGALDAIRVQARGRSVMNARINGNVSNGGGAGFVGLEIRQAQQTIPAGGTVFQATFNLEGLTTGLQTNHTTIVNYLNSQNPSITLANTDEIHSLGITGVPSIIGVPPLLFAPGGVEAKHDSLGAATEKMSSAPRALVGARAPRALPNESKSETDGVEVIRALNPRDLDATVAAALERWMASGLTSEQIALLRRMKFEVADLPGLHLGEANSG